jgi:hypothetical protein
VKIEGADRFRINGDSDYLFLDVLHDRVFDRIKISIYEMGAFFVIYKIPNEHYWTINVFRDRGSYEDWASSRDGEGAGIMVLAEGKLK